MLIRHLCLLFLVALTAASEPVAGDSYRIDTVAGGLEHPWSIAFLPDGRMLVTERAGRLRIIEDGGLLEAPVRGVPEAFVRSQAGLFEVMLDPDYEDNGWIYLSLAHGTARANSTRVVRGRLADGEFRHLEVLFTADPPRNTSIHYGGRMAFLADGTLAISLGDGGDFREHAQRLDNHTGTIVRIHRDGRNYGWPVATFGVDYSGAQVTPYTSRPGMEDPRLHWTPSIAPSGMTLYRGEQFPDWNGDLFVTALVAREVRRVMLDGERVTGQAPLFGEIGERLRCIETGPDGALYVLTDTPRGRVLRITAGE